LIKESLSKEFRVATNNRLFKEVLCGSSTAELIVRSSESPLLRYRNYRMSKTRELTPDRTLVLRNLIHDHFAKLEVDLTLIQLTITEVEGVVSVYFAKIKGRKLTKNQLSLISYLRKKTVKERRKEAHKKRFEEAKSLRLFLRNQYIKRVKSSKDRNEFLKIKLIHQTYLEKKPYDKIQKDFLEKLEQRTRDLSNSFNNSQSKKKPGLTLTKNLQEVENNMIGKEKDQKKERFPKEKYAYDFSKWFPDEEYRRNHQREVQKARKDISLELKKINRYLENSKKDCVRCNYRGTYTAPIDSSFAEYEDAIEKDPEKVTCVESKKVVQDVCYISHLFNSCETAERIEEDKCADDKESVSSEKIKKEKKRQELKAVSKKENVNSTSKLFKKKTQKRIKKQSKKKKAVITHLNQYNSLESRKKTRVAVKGEYKKFSRMLRTATIKLYQPSNRPISGVDDSQIKRKISGLNKSFPLNPDKIPLPYHDNKSRIEHDDKLISKFFEEQESRKQDDLKQDLLARNKYGLPKLDKSGLQSIKGVFESYFSENIISTEQILIRNIIQECIGYSGGSDVLRIINNKKILKKKVRKRLREGKPRKTVLRSVRRERRSVKNAYKKYRANKESVPVKLRVKKAFRKSIAPNAAKFLAIFGITFISLITFVSPEMFSFPVEIISGFLYLQVFVYLVFLYISIENYVFSTRKLFYLFISPIILFAFVTLFVRLEWMVVAAVCTPLAAFQSHRMKKRRLKINVSKIPLNSKGSLRYGTLIIFYHKFKFPILTVLSLILGGVFVWTYFFDPYNSVMAPAMLILIIFAFTFKSKTITRKIINELKKQKQKDRGIRTPKRNVVVVYDRKKRAALLILVFLVIFPITFGVNSTMSIQNPAYEFAFVSQEERLSTSSIDFSNLDYLPGLDDLEELSINGKFVIKCDVSPLFGQAARVRLELIPKEVPPIEGYYAKESYSVLSPYLNGPLDARELITEVSLNELDLMPGTYEAKVTYTILTGFAFRTSIPEVYEISIAKDDLTVISNDIFEDVLDSKYYGAVYTFEHPDDGSWTVVFDGKETLQSLLQTITKWHIDEFGQRDSGLAYYGRIQDKLSYDKSDPDVQSLLYYYSNALDSINKYAELRGIELNSPTKSHIALSEMISSKNELVMNEYQIKVWDDDMTKAYHIIYHLSKYLGFDPITFTPLDDNIFEPSTGDYRRHHFLALMFRKMTSHIDDVMLTSNELHIKHYETPLRNKGLDMEIYVKQVMKSLVQLIEMRDGSGNYMKIKEEHMRKVLYKNFGEVAGEKVLEKWEKQGDFMKSLGAFNDRRLKAFNGDYKQFLIDDYKNAYSAHFNRISKITYTKILTTQDNLDYLNAIYGLKLTLRPISKKLEDLY